MIYLTECYAKETWYFEVDEEGTAFRQVLIEKGKESKISNLKRFDFFLSEKELPLDDPGLKRISKEVFEKVWDEINVNQLGTWLEQKEKFPLGTKVEGYIEVFYPQGVIVRIPSHEALGVADYDECAKNSQKANMHKDLVVRAEVIGYDEVNYWFILGNPEVLDREYNNRR
ncbi:hypothetical protein A8L34_04740 [Bacillus sp. FJAT-27264]|uniref:hypothetical protein n=1 Tax=Paenibacillus sp. (strain DSM 101736 / FJAT-27264) TaxID=1850362 RepID=UPI0008080AA9|nr:hypothetical protein [Bacillus sp. FJAT-27264]OBZ18863.1 hypothetical protein A8L34_04740 [Bacillus sp. FJAT-27264]